MFLNIGEETLKKVSSLNPSINFNKEAILWKVFLKNLEIKCPKNGGTNAKPK